MDFSACSYCGAWLRYLGMALRFCIGIWYGRFFWSMKQQWTGLSTISVGKPWQLLRMPPERVCRRRTTNIIYWYLHFCFMIVCIAVLHTLVRNRAIGPAQSEPKGLPSATPVGPHITKTPTFNTYIHKCTNAFVSYLKPDPLSNSFIFSTLIIFFILIYP